MADVGSMPTADDFRDLLKRKFESAAADGEDHVVIQSRDLHTELGGYPGRNHRMRACCKVMYKERGSEDKVLESPPSGQGANLVICYKIPR